MFIRRAYLAWIPALVLAVATIFAAYFFATLGGEESQAFRPLKVTDFDVSPKAIPQGGPFSFKNGVCVKDDKPVAVEYTLGLQREGVDPFVPNATVVFVDARAIPLKPGCQFNEPIAATLPATIEPGSWHVYATVVARGPEGQVQRINVISNTFLILSP